MKIRSIVLILCLISAIVCFVGCKKKSEPIKTDSNTIEPNIAPVKTKGKVVEPDITVKVDSNVVSSSVADKVEERKIVATVNGVDILKSDYEARVEQQINPVQRQMPANFFEQYKKELSKKVLDEMIVDILIAQKVKQHGIVVTDQEIDNRINEIARRQKMTLQDFHEMQKAKGEDFGQFKDKVRQNLQFEKLVEAEYGPIDVNEGSDAQNRRRELASQYVQKLKSEAKITYISP